MRDALSRFEVRRIRTSINGGARRFNSVKPRKMGSGEYPTAPFCPLRGSKYSATSEKGRLDVRSLGFRTDLLELRFEE